MPHPIMFDEDDPLLAQVRALCLAYPEAAERISHGRPNFFTTRTFCYFGGGERIEGDGPARPEAPGSASARAGATWVAHDAAVLVRPDPADEPALRQDPRFFRPAYLGPSGWLGLDVDAETDWSEVAELVDASYRVTAPRRLVRLLDA